jgi:hypothetical protein
MFSEILSRDRIGGAPILLIMRQEVTLIAEVLYAWWSSERVHE